MSEVASPHSKSSFSLAVYFAFIGEDRAILGIFNFNMLAIWPLQMFCSKTFFQHCSIHLVMNAKSLQCLNHVYLSSCFEYPFDVESPAILINALCFGRVCGSTCTLWCALIHISLSSLCCVQISASNP